MTNLAACTGEADTIVRPLAMHPFERSGLGKAPFRFVGAVQQDIRYGEACVGVVNGVEIMTKKGGTCAHCGTYIVNMFDVMSSDGKRFHVGSDCVLKTGDAKLVAAVKKAVSKAAKVKREAKADAVKAELAALLADEATRAKLAALKHVSPYGRETTLLDHADFVAPRCGAAGRARLLKFLASKLA